MLSRRNCSHSPMITIENKEFEIFVGRNFSLRPKIVQKFFKGRKRIYQVVRGQYFSRKRSAKKCYIPLQVSMSPSRGAERQMSTTSEIHKKMSNIEKKLSRRRESEYKRKMSQSTNSRSGSLMSTNSSPGTCFFIPHRNLVVLAFIA